MFHSDNHLLAGARHGRLRLPAHLLAKNETFFNKIYPIVAIVAGIFMVVVAQLLFAVPWVIYQIWQLPAGATDDALVLEQMLLPQSVVGQTILLIGSFLPLVLLIGLWLWVVEQRRLGSAGLRWPGAGWQYGRGLLVGLAMFGSAVLVMVGLGWAKVQPGGGTAVLGGVLLLGLGWLVQGGAEELLTRGFLLPIIAIRYSLRWGIALSSSLFALLHLFNPHVSPIAMLNLLLFGLFAAFYALREEGLWGICALHSVWNWVQGNVFGLAVSGTPLGEVTVWRVTVDGGPPLMTGGAFGPEGGLVVTAVLLLAIWLTLRSPAPTASSVEKQTWTRTGK